MNNTELRVRMAGIVVLCENAIAGLSDDLGRGPYVQSDNARVASIIESVVDVLDDGMIDDQEVADVTATIWATAEFMTFRTNAEYVRFVVGLFLSFRTIPGLFPVLADFSTIVGLIAGHSMPANAVLEFVQKNESAIADLWK